MCEPKRKIRSANKTEESEEWRREARIYGPKDIVRLTSSYRLCSATAAKQKFGFYCLLAACLSLMFAGKWQQQASSFERATLNNNLNFKSFDVILQKLPYG